MKIKMRCVESSRILANDGKTTVWRARFATVIDNEKEMAGTMGNVVIESQTQIHYKPGQDYDITLSAASGIVIPKMPATIRGTG